MKKMLLAAAAILVASTALVSCGGGNPAEKAKKIATDTKAAIEKESNPMKQMEILNNAAKELDEVLASCKTAEDSASVVSALQEL